MRAPAWASRLRFLYRLGAAVAVVHRPEASMRPQASWRLAKLVAFLAVCITAVIAVAVLGDTSLRDWLSLPLDRAALLLSIAAGITVPVVVIIVGMVGVAREQRRRERGRCPHCDYDLRATP